LFFLKNGYDILDQNAELAAVYPDPAKSGLSNQQKQMMKGYRFSLYQSYHGLIKIMQTCKSGTFVGKKICLR
jgi:hypothetical protein